MPKISIIIPVYNTEKFLAKCLDSVINQDYQNFEIVIIDDGSTDNSPEIINQYINSFPEKIISISKTHTGVSDCRNLGISKCSGQYFIFVDSDDYIAENLLTSLLPYIDKNPDLVKYKLSIITDGKKQTVNGPVFDSISGEDAFNRLVHSDVLLESPCLYLYKKDFFINNKFQFLSSALHEDFGLLPLVILRAKSVVSTNIFGYFYISRNNSITKNNHYENTIKKAYDLLSHYDNMILNLPNYNLSKSSVANLKSYFSNSIILKTKDLKKADQIKYINEIKKRKLVKNIKIYNLKSYIKKILLLINIKSYLYFK